MEPEKPEEPCVNITLALYMLAKGSKSQQVKLDTFLLRPKLGEKGAGENEWGDKSAEDAEELDPPLKLNE